MIWVWHISSRTHDVFAIDEMVVTYRMTPCWGRRTSCRHIVHALLCGVEDRVSHHQLALAKNLSGTAVKKWFEECSPCGRSTCNGHSFGWTKSCARCTLSAFCFFGLGFACAFGVRILYMLESPRLSSTAIPKEDVLFATTTFLNFKLLKIVIAHIWTCS